MTVEGCIVLHRLELEGASIATSHGAHGDRPLYLLSIEGGPGGYAEVTGLPNPAPGDPGIDAVIACLREYVLPLLQERSARRGGIGEPHELRPSLNAQRDTAFAVHALESLLLDRWANVTGASLLGRLAGQLGPVALARTWLLDAIGSPDPKPGDRLRAKVLPGNALERAVEIAARYPGVEVALDANGSFAVLEDRDLHALVDALAAIPEVVLEQPLARQDLAGHALLRRRGVRVYLDESASSLANLRAIARYEAADGVLLKPARLGGPLATTQALAECERLGLSAGIGGMLEAELGRGLLRMLAAHPAADLAGDVGPSGEYLPDDPTSDGSAAARPSAADAAHRAAAQRACAAAEEIERFPITLGEVPA